MRIYITLAILSIFCNVYAHPPHIPLSDNESYLFTEETTPSRTDMTWMRIAAAPLVEVGMVDLLGTSHHSHIICAPIPMLIVSYLINNSLQEQLTENTYRTLHLLYGLIVKGIYIEYCDEQTSPEEDNPRRHAILSTIWGSLISYAYALAT